MKAHLFLTAVLAIIVTNASTQPQLYTFDTPDTTTFTQEQEDRWEIVRDDTTYSETNFIDLGDIRSLSGYEGKIQVEFPSSSSLDSLTFRVNRIGGDPDEFFWYGQLVDTTKGHYGDLFYLDDGTETHGWFDVSYLTYEIIDLTGGVHVLAELDTALNWGSCGNESSSIPNIENSEHTRVSLRSNNPCDIRVVFAHDPDVKGSEAKLKARARQDIFAMNVALKNSEVYPKDARYVFAGVEELPSFSQGDRSKTDIDALTTGDAADELQDAMTDTKADIAIVYVPKLYLDPEGLVSGRAKEIETGNHDHAFCVVTVHSRLRRLSSAHESAHIIGARHHNDETPPEEHRAHSIILPTGIPPLFDGNARTIVYGGEGNKKHIQHFSNPDVDFAFQATGTSTRDNAYKLRDNGCDVAEFDNTVLLGAAIDGPLEASVDDDVTLTASPIGGVSPYSYTWEGSEDGVNFTSIGSTASITYTVVESDNNFNFIRLKVCGTNDCCMAYHRIFTLEFIAVQGDDSKPAEILAIHPNPAKGQFTVAFELSEDSDVALTTASINGSITNQHKGFYVKGRHQVQLTSDTNISKFESVSLFVNGVLVDSRKLLIIKQ